MIRQLGLGLAAGLLCALMFLSPATGFTLGAVLSYLAPMPLMMAGLAFGLKASALAAGVAAAAVAAVLGAISPLPFAVIVAGPALLVTNRALLWRSGADGSAEWYPPGLVLAWLTAAGLGLLLCAAAFLLGSADGVEAGVSQFLGRVLDLMAGRFPAEQRELLVKVVTPIFPALIIASWLTMSVVNALAAQAVLARTGHARRPSPTYRELMLPEWLGWALVGAVVLAVVARGSIGYVAANAVMVLLVPFVCLGLAGIHRWARGRANAGFLLAATYGLLILANGWAAAAVAGLGLVRFWTMRFRRHDSGGGMEG